MLRKEILMGMTIVAEIADKNADKTALEEVFSYFKHIDEKFSVYKKTSEITALNSGLVNEEDCSEEMKEVLELSEKTKKETGGYFDIRTPSGDLNPSGLVKGWAIFNASKILLGGGYQNFYIDAGGDIQTHGKNADGEFWTVGIRNPFNPEKEVVKILSIGNKGVATSGTYARGQHIYNPHDKKEIFTDIVSLTVVGPNVYEADRFATAAFAMGRKGIEFIEKLESFEGYSIDKNGIATETSGFGKYVKKDA